MVNIWPTYIERKDEEEVSQIYDYLTRLEEKNRKWMSDWQRPSLVLDSNIFYILGISENPVRADKMLWLETEKIMKPRHVFDQKTI